MAGQDVAALVAQAEVELAAGEIDAATDKLGEVTRALLDTAERHDLLGRSLWLSALISLARGELGEFADQAQSAIDSLERANDLERVEQARRLVDEIMRRVDSDLTVRAGGALGLLTVLEFHLERLILRAETDAGWDEVDRDRSQLAQLVGAPTGDGEGQPLSRLLRVFDLDQIDAVALTVLAPLATHPALRLRALALLGDDGSRPGVPSSVVAGLSFANQVARAELLRRLAPGAPLRRLGIVELLEAGAPEFERLELASAVAWALCGASIEEMPPLAGVSVLRPSEASIPIDQTLTDTAQTLVRWAKASASPMVLVGRRGAGKATLAAAAAAASGRALVVIDAAAVTWSRWEQTLTAVARDSVLGNALVYLRCDLDLPPLHAIVNTPGLHLVCGVDPGDADGLREALRSLRADVVSIEVPELGTVDQVEAWQRALAAHPAVTAIDSGELGPLIRPGLVLGDLMDTITEALARGEAHGQVVSCVTLATVLTERANSELAIYAEPMPTEGGAMLAANARELDRAAQKLRRAHSVLDDWGIASVSSVVVIRGAVAVVGAGPSERLAAATHLARQLSMSLCRIDLADLMHHPASVACARLGAAVGAAGRAGALVLLSGADALVAPASQRLANAIGTLLAVPCTGFVLAADRADSLPSALRTRIVGVVDVVDVVESASSGPERP